MDSNVIMWIVIIGILLLPPALALIARNVDRRKQARTPSELRLAELAKEAPDGETSEERAETQEIQGERDRLIDAKNVAEKAYEERVSVAEHEFNALKVREDVQLRAAELFLEHAQEYERGRLGSVRDQEDALEIWGHESAFDGQIFATDASARRIEGHEKRRSQRILSAREHLADVMLERHLALAAAEKKFAHAKAQRADLLSAAAALEAFDTRNR